MPKRTVRGINVYWDRSAHFRGIQTCPPFYPSNSRSLQNGWSPYAPTQNLVAPKGQLAAFDPVFSLLRLASVWQASQNE